MLRRRGFAAPARKLARASAPEKEWPSHRVCSLIALKSSSQISLDFLLSLTAVLVTELHADSRRALVLRALRGHPDHASRHRQLLVFTHQVQQHEHFIAQAIVAVGRDEQAPVAHERHIGQIQSALVLDRECQKTWFVAARSHSYLSRRRNRVSSASPRLIGVSSADTRSRTPSSSSNSPRIFKTVRGRCK